MATLIKINEGDTVELVTGTVYVDIKPAPEGFGFWTGSITYDATGMDRKVGNFNASIVVRIIEKGAEK